MSGQQRSFFYRNGLSIFALGFFLLFWAGQAVTGWYEYNESLTDLGGSPVSFLPYLKSGHFVESTFENFESEFLQMGLYVLATVWLRQWGSSESKPLEGSEDVDREPVPGPDAPWPVRKGGFVLKLYKNSLSIAFLLLFLVSFTFHAWGSYENYQVKQTLKHAAIEPLSDFMFSTKLWFESFQNWQSEFLSIASIVILSIFLRQQGSPESKPVDMSNAETP